ncbi:inner centromere protein-like [Hylaeus volcanicus]|uniref:inner centromere protein-like n=1 Tax=Hylaeus volcanicus TaxID=313075 RepID=UPI0023B79744|nr:inner centromere protein-like [Hylaeus volcanicus]
MANKDKVKTMIVNDMLNICNHCTEVKELINENLKDTMEYLNALLTQIPQSTFGPLISKTPKPLRKKGAQRIETIPEDDVVDCTLPSSVTMSIKGKSNDNRDETMNGNITEMMVGRTKREASKKAADSIKRQQSITLNTKLRRPLSPEEDNTIIKEIRKTQSKRKKSAKSSSDEESSQGPRKHSKLEENVLGESTAKKTEDTNLQNNISTNNTTTLQNKNDKKETLRKSSIMWHSTRKRTLSQNHNLSNKESKTINDTVIAPRTEVMEEPSMYEDAIEKPIPIMNSTMNLNSTITMQKMMNATVVLEPLSAIKLNETVTITKAIGSVPEKKNQQKTNRPMSESRSSRTSKLSSPSLKALQDRMHPLKEVVEDKEFNDLITDDESSPEIKKSKANVRHEGRKRQRPIVHSVSSSEDEILNTPAKPTLKEVNTTTVLQEVKASYKPNALFSPYAKESVKKRVEAFEQAGLNSPKVEVDVPTRLTRTKTRAIAAAQAESSESTKTMGKTVVQKLARKSLAKAKKISLAKYAKDTDEYKENKMLSTQKISRIAAAPAEKVNQKYVQKTTPLGKTKIQLPLSVNRIANTPANSQIIGNHTKALSATRSNIITSVDSFIHSVKSVNKRNSIEKIEEKKRKMNDEVARKKREEALRLQTEEKRRKRQEKELKNKLAREAKEKQELEKRHKAEKEREEKARLAQQMQEKQREEMERKRLIQIQRAQEKEERRRQEEQQRLQRLQEQEEAERLLAEQRRREQEAEKRKEAEARAQQQAAAEALRAKNQVLIAQAKYASKHNQGPTNYILDSEPDEDESDDETRPKHVIPYWAQPHIRKTQLAMQRYIPDKAVSRFFDTKKCTPDLSELFQGIDRNRLKRTSSAIWKTPPRYSMMETE